MMTEEEIKELRREQRDQRIQELAKLARTETNNAFAGQTFDWGDWHKLYDKKFAMLIAAECFNLEPDYINDEHSKGLEDYRDGIKHHFVVE